MFSGDARRHIGRWKQVIGDRLRAHTDERRATEVEVAVHVLNRMLWTWDARATSASPDSDGVGGKGQGSRMKPIDAAARS
jgi:hypothetical protein